MIYLQLALMFLKIGFFGFGGGYAILPMIFQDIQQLDNQITADDFANLIALSQVTPGPIAINAATFVGYRCAGLMGSIVATVFVSIPSFILILTAMAFLNKFHENRVIASVLKGIRPATVALMTSAFIFIAQSAFVLSEVSIRNDFFSKINIDPLAIIIFVICMILIKFAKVGAIKITLIGGGISLIVLSIREFV